MTSLTCEESIKLDVERLQFIDRIMSDLGFRRHIPHESHRAPYQFTDLILYYDADSGDSVSVYFPYEDQAARGLEIATQITFGNKTNSPEWSSLHEFRANIGIWIERCRRKGRSSG